MMRRDHEDCADAPLMESCPPKLYGGTERVVSNLTEELVRLGHEVTLFASGDSRTAAKLEPCCARRPAARAALQGPARVRDDDAVPGPAPGHQFDILHFHTDYLHFPVFADVCDKTVTTMHGRLDMPDLPIAMREFPRCRWCRFPTRSAGRCRGPTGTARCCTGCPRIYYRLGDGSGGYLAFLGRISPEKRPDRAIAIARRCGMPLQIAAKVDRVDREYHEAEIAPLLDDPLDRVRRRDRRGAKRTYFSAMQRRCCFRSTGPNRSGW